MIARDDLLAEAKRLKAAVSIADVIGETLRLKRAGRTLIALCPFHGEKTPSFHVYKDGHYHCFGCGAHGDVFNWLMQAHGVSAAGDGGADDGPVVGGPVGVHNTVLLPGGTGKPLVERLMLGATVVLLAFCDNLEGVLGVSLRRAAR
jgi:CHC2 zinc finger